MDMMQAMTAMQNPQGTMLQYAMQGMISQNPQQWQQVNNLFANKSHKEQVSLLKKMYKERGMDLAAIAQQWGVTL